MQAALRQGADAARIAEMAVTTWRRVDAALSPIIGRSGITALFRRSLFLAVPEYPWLTPVTAVTGADARRDGLALLQQASSEQTGAVAATANCALLQTFCDLLGGLIGAPLTERLLQSAWNAVPGDPTDQEHPR